MKIEYKKYNYQRILNNLNYYYNLKRVIFNVPTDDTQTEFKNLSYDQRGIQTTQYIYPGCTFNGINRDNQSPVFFTDRSVDMMRALFINIKNLFSFSNRRIQQCTFFFCIFENVCFTIGDYIGEISFDNCIFINCSGLDTFKCVFTNCILDTKYGKQDNDALHNIGPSVYNHSFIGSPQFISKDLNDLWDGTNNPNGVGYCRIVKWRGYDYDTPNQNAGINADWDTPVIQSNSYYWIPSYVCNESKKIVLFNNQDYVDLDGNRRNYFDKTINEITLDFTKNGLTKEDMAAVKDIYENSDNEITIYPDENDTTNYIIGRLSKSDLDYSKMINSYWDNGKIDDERFNGVRMVIRVTDDSHFTRSV